MSEVGDVEQRIADLGISKGELAQLCEVSPSAVSNWISRDRLPKFVELVLASMGAPRPEGGPTETIPRGRYQLLDQVTADGVPGLVARREWVDATSKCWLYYVVEIRRIELNGKLAWVRWGSALRYLEKHLVPAEMIVEIADRHVDQKKK